MAKVNTSLESLLTVKGAGSAYDVPSTLTEWRRWLPMLGITKLSQLGFYTFKNETVAGSFRFVAGQRMIPRKYTVETSRASYRDATRGIKLNHVAYATLIVGLDQHYENGVTSEMFDEKRFKGTADLVLWSASTFYDTYLLSIDLSWFVKAADILKDTSSGAPDTVLVLDAATIEINSKDAATKFIRLVTQHLIKLEHYVDSYGKTRTEDIKIVISPVFENLLITAATASAFNPNFYMKREGGSQIYKYSAQVHHFLGRNIADNVYVSDSTKAVDLSKWLLIASEYKPDGTGPICTVVGNSHMINIAALEANQNRAITFKASYGMEIFDALKPRMYGIRTA